MAAVLLYLLASFSRSPAGQEGVAAGGVQHVARRGTPAPPSGASCAVTVARSPRRAEGDVGDARVLQRGRRRIAAALRNSSASKSARFTCQAMVRAWFSACAKGKAQLRPVRSETNSAPGLCTPMRAHLLQHAEPLQDVEVARQQALADVEARMRLLLQQRHAPPLLGQQRGGGGAGRAAADDEDVGERRSHMRGEFFTRLGRVKGPHRSLRSGQ